MNSLSQKAFHQPKKIPQLTDYIKQAAYDIPKYLDLTKEENREKMVKGMNKCTRFIARFCK